MKHSGTVSKLHGGHKSFSTYIKFGLGMLTWIHKMAFIFLTLFSMQTLLKCVKISSRTPPGAQYIPVPRSTVHTQDSDHIPALTIMSPPPLGLVQTADHQRWYTPHTLRVHKHTQMVLLSVCPSLKRLRRLYLSINSSFSKKMTALFRVLVLDYLRGTFTTIPTETALLSLSI